MTGGWVSSGGGSGGYGAGDEGAGGCGSGTRHWVTIVASFRGSRQVVVDGSSRWIISETNVF